MQMQKRNAIETCADESLLQKLINYKPQTNFKDGTVNFIKWYRGNYNE